MTRRLSGVSVALVLLGSGLLLLGHHNAAQPPSRATTALGQPRNLTARPTTRVARVTASEPTPATTGPVRSTRSIDPNRDNQPEPARPDTQQARRTTPVPVAEVTGTASPPPLPTRAGPAPQAEDVDEPGRVAVAVLTAIHTSDTTTDRSARDAYTRALPLLSGQVAADVRTSANPTGPGADWTRWTAHRAHTVVTVTASSDSGGPPDTPSAAYRQYAVTVTPVGRDHWQDVPVTYVAFTTLAREPAGWRVVGMSESRT